MVTRNVPGCGAPRSDAVAWSIIYLLPAHPVVTSAAVVAETERDKSRPLALLSTDRSSYVASPFSATNPALAITIVTHFVNQSSVPIYLPRCGPGNQPPLAGFQAADENGMAVGAADQVPFACGAGIAIVVNPGEARTDTVVVPYTGARQGRVFFLAGSCANPETIGGSILGCATSQMLPESARESSLLTVEPLPK